MAGLTEIKRKTLIVPGDGNCAYYSAATALTTTRGDVFENLLIRNKNYSVLVARLYEKHPALREGFVALEDTTLNLWQHFVDTNTLFEQQLILSSVLREIHAPDSVSGDWTNFDEIAAFLGDKYGFGVEYTIAGDPEIKKHQVEAGRPLARLFYVNENHFNAEVEITDTQYKQYQQDLRLFKEVRGEKQFTSQEPVTYAEFQTAKAKLQPSPAANTKRKDEEEQDTSGKSSYYKIQEAFKAYVETVKPEVSNGKFKDPVISGINDYIQTERSKLYREAKATGNTELFFALKLQDDEILKAQPSPTALAC